MDVVVARTIHVLAIVLWIGGVGFVTTVLMPAVRRGRLKPRPLRLNLWPGASDDAQGAKIASRAGPTRQTATEWRRASGAK